MIHSITAGALAGALFAFSIPAMASDVTYFPAASGAPFPKAVQIGDVLILSGEIGVKPDGKLPTDFSDQSRQLMNNVEKTLRSHGSGMRDIFKCTVFLTDMTQWRAFNEVYRSYFSADRLPARTAAGVNQLVLGAGVEMECWAKIPARTAGKPSARQRVKSR